MRKGMTGMLAATAWLLVLPWLILYLIDESAGIIAIFVSFIVGTVIWGWFAGRILKNRWYVPVFPPLLFGVVYLYFIFRYGYNVLEKFLRKITDVSGNIGEPLSHFALFRSPAGFMLALFLLGIVTMLISAAVQKLRIQKIRNTMPLDKGNEI